MAVRAGVRMVDAINNEQPSLGLTELIVVQGEWPVREGDGYSNAGSLGFLRLFAGDFAFNGTALAQGQIVNITSNTSLFALLGTYYGGNGRQTYALPNLNSTVSVGVGQGVGLPPYTFGERFGADQITLTNSQLPGSVGGGGQPFDNHQASAAFRYVIDVEGPLHGGVGSNDMLGAIVRFAGSFTPGGFMEADGRLLNIADYPDLFQVIGTIYGGDGETTFALPDLRGRTPIGASGDHPLGQVGGQPATTLVNGQIPVQEGGAGWAVKNKQPYLAVNYLVATSGYFPSRDAPGASADMAFVGEIMAFAGVTPPPGWMLANGAQLPVNQNQALYAIIGNTFGGDQIAMRLPDLGGRAPQGVGGDVQLGEESGSESFTLSTGQAGIMPTNTVPGPQSIVEDGALVLSGGSALSVSGAGSATRTVTLSATHGVLSLSETTGLMFVIGDGVADGAMTFGGSVSDINAALSGLRYAPDADYHGPAQITLTTTNSQGMDTDTVTVTVTSVPEPVNGDNAPNALNGSAGDDVITAGGGADQLVGSAGNDVLDGGWGSDVADYSTLGGPVKVNLGVFAAQEVRPGKFDTLRGVENLIGGASGDRLTGGAGPNRLTGGGDDDVLNGAGGDDVLDGGAGSDSYHVGSAGDVITGEATGPEIDTVYASVSYSIANVANVERLYAASAAGVTLTGNDLANGMLGGAGDDVLIGGAGADRLNGQGGADVMRGGTGADTYWVDDAGDVIEGELAGPEIDNVLARVSYSIADTAFVERLTADSDAGLSLTGNDLANLISGRGGDDALQGGYGADTLQGKGGGDRLDGGAGRDTLTGGAGADVFAFSAAGHSRLGARDRITDFELGTDRIDVSALDAVPGSGDDAFRFIGEAAFSGTAGELRQFTLGPDTLVEADLDGDGKGDLQVVVAGLHTFSDGDFFL